MPAVVTKVDDLLHIEITGRWSEIEETRDKVKNIAGRRWNPDKKVWVLPADPGTADRLLKTIRPEASDELMEWLRQSMTHYEESLTSPLPDDAAGLKIPWAYQRMSHQPAVVNDEKFNGATPWQRAGIDLMAREGRALLCDDMGLGKTFETISAVEEWRLRNVKLDGTVPDGPRLVVAPNSVLGAWVRELSRWLDGPHVQIIDAKNPAARHAQLATAIREDAWTIVNWEQLRVKRIEQKTKRGGKVRMMAMKDPLFQYPQAAIEWPDVPFDEWDISRWRKAERLWKGASPYWLSAIADEIHRAKNKDSQQTKGLHRVEGRTMYGLTGTPIMNAPDEIWSLLAWLWPHEYHERGAAFSPGAVAYWPFYMAHVDFWEDHRGRKTVTGVKNADGLRFALKDKVIRRTSSILGLKGRKRIYYDVPLTAKQQSLYDEAEKVMWLDVMAAVEAGDVNAIKLAQAAAEGADTATLMRIPNGAARFVRLQQVIENAQLIGGPDESAGMDDFEQKYADSRPEQWIVWCNYKESCEILTERLRRKYGAKAEVYNGDVPAPHRTQIEDAYQRGEIDVIVGTIPAMFQGITLTSGHLQHWLSRSVVPAHNEQGEARQDRMGQQAQVLVYIPQAPGTVATDRVHVINRLKETIVKTVVPQDRIEEVNV